MKMNPLASGNHLSPKLQLRDVKILSILRPKNDIMKSITGRVDQHHVNEIGKGHDLKALFMMCHFCIHITGMLHMIQRGRGL